jgi:hypothetical protein
MSKLLIPEILAFLHVESSILGKTSFCQSFLFKPKTPCCSEEKENVNAD